MDQGDTPSPLHPPSHSWWKLGLDFVLLVMSTEVIKTPLKNRLIWYMCDGLTFRMNYINLIHHMKCIVNFKINFHKHHSTINYNQIKKLNETTKLNFTESIT